MTESIINPVASHSRDFTRQGSLLLVVGLIIIHSSRSPRGDKGKQSEDCVVPRSSDPHFFRGREKSYGSQKLVAHHSFLLSAKNPLIQLEKRKYNIATLLRYYNIAVVDCFIACFESHSHCSQSASLADISFHIISYRIMARHE